MAPDALRRAAIVAALLLCACGGARGRGAPDPQAAVEPGPDQERRAAVEACQSALEQVDAASPEARYALVARGCADLFSMPVCGEAIRLSPEAEPGLRARMIAVGCQFAYCPALEAAEVRPELCGLRPATMTPAELRTAWGPFLRAVLALELDLEASSPELLSLAIGLSTLSEVPVEAAAAEPSAPAGPVLVVEVGRDGRGYSLSAVVDGASLLGPLTLPLEPNRDDFSGLLEAAARQAAGGSAVIRIGEGVADEVVIQLVEALGELGITDVTIEGAQAPGQPTAGTD